MPTISLKAILNNANLTGAAINLREGIASFCSTDNPSTAQSLKEIAKRIGMDTGQASRALRILEEKGEVASHQGKFYLLRLDDYQIERIAEKNFRLLEKLAELGCEDARREVDKKSILNDSESTSNRFLLHFFLFSELTISHLKMTHSQFGVDDKSILNDSESTPLKENYGENVFLNGVNGEEEEGSDVPSPRDAGPASSSAGASADSDIPPAGDTDDPQTEKLNGGKNHENERQSQWVNTHIRNDLQPIGEWLDYIQNLPECRNIPVRELWQKLLRKCKKQKTTASRPRFLRKWLWPDVEAGAEEIQEFTEEDPTDYAETPVSESERRRRSARRRIEFDRHLDDELERAGIVQSSGL